MLGRYRAAQHHDSDFGATTRGPLSCPQDSESKVLQTLNADCIHLCRDHCPRSGLAQTAESCLRGNRSSCPRLVSDSCCSWHSGTDRITTTVLAVAVSLAVLIGVCLFLDVAGIPIGTRSVSLALAIFEVAAAVAVWFSLRTPRPLDESGPASVERNLSPHGEGGLSRGETIPWVRNSAAIVGAILTIFAGIAIVHLACANPHIP